jgi:hypothetical protein
MLARLVGDPGVGRDDQQVGIDPEWLVGEHQADELAVTVGIDRRDVRRADVGRRIPGQVERGEQRGSPVAGRPRGDEMTVISEARAAVRSGRTRIPGNQAERS